VKGEGLFSSKRGGGVATNLHRRDAKTYSMVTVSNITRERTCFSNKGRVPLMCRATCGSGSRPRRAFQGILPVKLLAFSSRGFLRSDAGKPTRFSFIRVSAVNKRTVDSLYLRSDRGGALSINELSGILLGFERS
jgi:hypothetical protein